MVKNKEKRSIIKFQIKSKLFHVIILAEITEKVHKPY
jgi:hypothetical protein